MVSNVLLAWRNIIIRHIKTDTLSPAFDVVHGSKYKMPGWLFGAKARLCRQVLAVTTQMQSALLNLHYNQRYRITLKFRPFQNILHVWFFLETKALFWISVRITTKLAIQSDRFGCKVSTQWLFTFSKGFQYDPGWNSYIQSFNAEC